MIFFLFLSNTSGNEIIDSFLRAPGPPAWGPLPGEGRVGRVGRDPSRGGPRVEEKMVTVEKLYQREW